MIVLKTKCQCAQKFNWKMHLENVFEKENGFFSPLSPLGLLGPVSQPPRPLSLSWAAAQPAFLPLSPLSHRQAGPACQFLPPPPQLLSLSLGGRAASRTPAPHDLHPMPRALDVLKSPAREPSPSFPISLFRAFATAHAHREPPPEHHRRPRVAPALRAIPSVSVALVSFPSFSAIFSANS